MTNALISLKATRDLGPLPVLLLARYRLKLASGLLASRVARDCQRAAAVKPGRLRPLFWLPGRAALRALLEAQGLADLHQQVEALIAGQAPLFGGEPQPLLLTPQPPLRPWTAYENEAGGVDIKFTWEPARFGWAFSLGRAYLVTGDERCPQAFWDQFDIFQQANPPGLGPNWASAQEVALRLLAFVFAAQVFAASPRSTPPRLLRLLQAIAVHAARIPPSLDYARAQNNNHLLSEAAALYTAGLALPHHPVARGWRRLGWRWFHAGLQRQIDPDGAYLQHSANYQRLVLHLALWVAAVAESAGERFPEKSLYNLAAATRWLLDIQDPTSGALPNLGPNDGALLLPLASAAFGDYRPVLAAAAQRFLNEKPYPPGAWDELGLWLAGKPSAGSGAAQGALQKEGQKNLLSGSGLSPNRTFGTTPATGLHTPHVLRSPGGASWAYLRAARFSSRPGHADQLHLDLWWRGLNVARDAGTFLYNAPPPWDNALGATAVHNTLLLEGRDQMSRAGRFLWLDWAQAEITAQEQAGDGSWQRLAARHHGYRSLGAVHQRMLTCHAGDTWEIQDDLLPLGKPGKSLTTNLHWLLPDWPWELEQTAAGLALLRLSSEYGCVELQVQAGKFAQPDRAQPEDAPPAEAAPPGLQVSLLRAGLVLAGEAAPDPVLGWFSPRYAYKEPALSLVASLTGALPLSLTTRWRFPAGDGS